MTKEALDLQAKLQKADPDIRLYVTTLEGENKILHHTLAKLQEQDKSKDIRIKTLEKKIKEGAP